MCDNQSKQLLTIFTNLNMRAGMTFRILKRDSIDYKEKLRSIRAAQLKKDTQRWANVTERSEPKKLLEKLLYDGNKIETNTEKTLSLAKKLKEQIIEENLDVKIVQGNMEIRPALRLLDDHKV